MSIIRRIGGAVQAAASRHPELGRALAALKQSGETGRSDGASAEPATGAGGGFGGALALGGLVLGAAAAAAGGDAEGLAPSSGGGADQFLADRCASLIAGLDTTWGGQ